MKKRRRSSGPSNSWSFTRYKSYPRSAESYRKRYAFPHRKSSLSNLHRRLNLLHRLHRHLLSPRLAVVQDLLHLDRVRLEVRPLLAKGCERVDDMVCHVRLALHAPERPAPAARGYVGHFRRAVLLMVRENQAYLRPPRVVFSDLQGIGHRSEERRVGKECRSRWSPYH